MSHAYTTSKQSPTSCGVRAGHARMRLFQRCVSLLQSAAEGGSQKALLTPLDCQADKLPAAVWACIIQHPYHPASKV